MSVIIKVDTGFSGAVHEEDTGLSISEWGKLTYEMKLEYYQWAIEENIEVYTVDENDNII